MIIAFCASIFIAIFSMVAIADTGALIGLAEPPALVIDVVAKSEMVASTQLQSVFGFSAVKVALMFAALAISLFQLMTIKPARRMAIVGYFNKLIESIKAETAAKYVVGWRNEKSIS